MVRRPISVYSCWLNLCPDLQTVSRNVLGQTALTKVQVNQKCRDAERCQAGASDAHRCKDFDEESHKDVQQSEKEEDDGTLMMHEQ